LRVSELVGLRLQDVRFDGRLLEVCVHGKAARSAHCCSGSRSGRRSAPGSPSGAMRAARKCSCLREASQ
jgi:hypothetical protein